LTKIITITKKNKSREKIGGGKEEKRKKTKKPLKENRKIKRAKKKIKFIFISSSRIPISPRNINKQNTQHNTHTHIISH